MKRVILLLILVASWTCGALAHEVRPAYLQLRETSPDIYDVLWKVPGQGDDLRLALDVEFPEGIVDLTPPRASFESNAYTERRIVRRTNGLGGGTLRIAGLDATMTDVLVRLEQRDGSVQIVRLTPSVPAFVVEATPLKTRVATTYLRLGVEHILLGYDHLLFVLALILIVRDRRLLVMTVTAFTIAHSITLALATLGVIRVPGRPVEAAIALSILLLATEIFRIRRGESSLTARWPWAVAFTFGLLHGFGFANALSETGLPHGDIPLALFTFNIGVELGQLAFIGVVLGVLGIAKRIALPTIVVRHRCRRRRTRSARSPHSGSSIELRRSGCDQSSRESKRQSLKKTLRIYPLASSGHRPERTPAANANAQSREAISGKSSVAIS